jgi:SAM-dependent methyltransferase
LLVTRRISEAARHGHGRGDGVIVRLRKSLARTLQRAGARVRNPAVGRVNFGDLRGTRPVSRAFGTDRGAPIDRYYIEGFLAEHATDVHGRVMEIGEDVYTRRFGGSRVQQSDVWHVDSGNPRATIVGDLSEPPPLEAERFDCLIVTQTLQYVADPVAAVRTLHRILAPGGVLLMTVPCITPVATRSQWGPRWYWGYTAAGLHRLLAGPFGAERTSVRSHGNVLVAIAFLEGVAVEELTRDELDLPDPDYPVIVTARACKARA